MVFEIEDVHFYLKMGPALRPQGVFPVIAHHVSAQENINRPPPKKPRDNHS